MDPVASLGALCDSGTVRLLSDVDSAGVVIARGRVSGRPVIAHATFSGSLDADGCSRIVWAVDTAACEGVPVVGLWHARPTGLDGAGHVFAAMVRASGRVPQICVALGPSCSDGGYGPAFSDVVIAGPDGFGGDVVCSSDALAVEKARQVTSLLDDHGHYSAVPDAPLPTGGRALALAMFDPTPATPVALATPTAASAQAAATPAAATPAAATSAAGTPAASTPAAAPAVANPSAHNPSAPTSSAVELRASIAPHLLTALGRMGGHTVGVLTDSGHLDGAAAAKAARFVRMCDALRVPLVVVAEAAEVSGRTSKLLHALVSTSVPRVTVVPRRICAPYFVMNSRSLGASAVLAWPDADMAGGSSRKRADEVISPCSTRRRIVEVLASGRVRRSTGLIPLQPLIL
ncbi:carboxyl transferase domain-containing protein [Lentzea sp. NPDC051838]|uniref:carboxyl transferase domain-containing protein n=1 Tax=Lentzea sp. NPDC051838 TaxID=3154849 RepID=UPI0034323573